MPTKFYYQGWAYHTQKFNYYSFPNFSPLFLFYSHIITTYSCDFYCISDNNATIHTVTIILSGEQDVIGADFSSESIYMKYCCLHVHLHHHHFKQDYFITFTIVNSNSYIKLWVKASGEISWKTSESLNL